MLILWYFSAIANKPKKLGWTATRELKVLETMLDKAWLMELGNFSLGKTVDEM